MKLVFDREARAEYLAWRAADVKVVERLNALINKCRWHPFKGIGKPEPLKATCQAGGRAGSTVSIGWCIALRVTAPSRCCRWRSVGIVMEPCRAGRNAPIQFD